MARPKQNSSSNRRLQILEEAAGLFKANGFNATSMRLLAEQTGMEAASLYNHISSKEELLREICFSVANDFNAHLLQLEADDSCASRKMEAIIRFHIHMLLTKYNDVYVSNRDWKHLKEPWLTNFLTQRKQYENRLAAIIQQGIDAGKFKPVHPHVAVLTILAAVRSIEYLQRSKKTISSKQIADDLVMLLLKGLEQ